MMEDALRLILARRQKHRIADQTHIRAAVLLPLYVKDGQYHILFIRRTDRVKVHKGQISFPGGAFEKKDTTFLATALRESEEEIGLLPQDVAVLGELDDEVAVVTNYAITPFVGRIPYPYPFKPDPIEVAELIEAPFSFFLDTDSCREEVLSDGRTSYTYKYKGRIIWGATARILKKFVDIWRQAQKDTL